MFLESKHYLLNKLPYVIYYGDSSNIYREYNILNGGGENIGWYGKIFYVFFKIYVKVNIRKKYT